MPSSATSTTSTCPPFNSIRSVLRAGAVLVGALVHAMQDVLRNELDRALHLPVGGHQFGSWIWSGPWLELASTHPAGRALAHLPAGGRLPPLPGAVP